MAPIKNTLISLLAVLPGAVVARNVLGPACFDGPCSDGSCCGAGGFCGLTDEFCGAGCTSGPCKEVDWRSLSCDIAKDEEKPGADRWTEAEANFAFDEAVNKWLDATGDGLERFFGEEKDGTRLDFPRFIAAALGGPTGMRCRELVDRNGCDSFFDCETQSDGPGGNMVLNSFVSLNNILWNWYDQLGRTAGYVQSSMGTFSSTFAPVPNEGLGLTLILDMISFGYVAVGAPMWKTVFKKMNFIKDGDNFGVVEGLTKDLITQGVTITKDATRAGTQLTSQNTLEERVGNMVRAWYASTDQLNQHLFSGDPLGLNDNLDLLKKTIADGRFVDADLDLMSAEEIDQQARRAIYGQLIPYAWVVGSGETSPFLLRSGKKCNEGGRPSHVPGDAPGWCFSDDKGFDEVFYLLGATGNEGCVNEDLFTGFKCRDFNKLPGIGELDGTKWGGVKEEDLAVAAFNTWWHRNGQTNADRPDEETDLNANQLLDDLIAIDIRAPGLVWLPVCDSDEAHTNWENKLNGKGRSAHFPCN
ncbi:Glucan endo-13-alpha-glucosidase agn1 [Fusarium albosuccineum]|uniref:Glucan endo-13-alpha-glucosidase agn1 n=1 Tax=Fusarium albosuccineum TaxID=1237068 RepID=A0A8H4L877_9HYPO|nr:Glucan endo-13-alpha-glucosidase agn1 [Fusarium albosuccineum]